MLSRTADNLFWMARHIERAENTARVLDVAHRTSLLPLDIEGPEAYLWYAPLNITGCANGYELKHGLARGSTVNRYLALDPENPASIYNCLRLARENARAARGAITSEMWEVINATWLELNRVSRDLDNERFTDFFDWVKDRSHLFRGVTLGTIIKDIALSFIKLGTFLERADNTARILDVKYHILFSENNSVMSAADFYQWGALLKSVSAFEAYRKIYRDVITPIKVAEIMILRDDMPRSLHNCMNEVEAAIIDINGSSGREARRRAGEIHAALHFGRIEDVFEQGLHDYLTDFLNDASLLGQEIRDAYLSRRDYIISAPIKKQSQTQQIAFVN
ncbi:alpha-E domain-containing protein [Methylomonas paludis]|uniref:Alpha-E domain-containing protein n=1 Tax=Methylomonas paludis TaxID=1173101 RepID=A0A975ML56_9GAMM|nr:alpha-E domain-containing protein [Methylomonas paludis]QWF69832.1 alpha-E domain-containing protein [Methylomonas paludis]